MSGVSALSKGQLYTLEFGDHLHRGHVFMKVVRLLGTKPWEEMGSKAFLWTSGVLLPASDSPSLTDTPQYKVTYLWMFWLPAGLFLRAGPGLLQLRIGYSITQQEP